MCLTGKKVMQGGNTGRIRSVLLFVLLTSALTLLFSPKKKKKKKKKAWLLLAAFHLPDAGRVFQAQVSLALILSYFFFF